jgi:hypothetical protein
LYEFEALKFLVGLKKNPLPLPIFVEIRSICATKATLAIKKIMQIEHKPMIELNNLVVAILYFILQLLISVPTTIHLTQFKTNSNGFLAISK